MENNLESALKLSLAWCDVNTITPPLDLEIRAALALKTVGYYTRVLNRLVSDLYGGAITKDEFIDKQAALIEQQLRRAYNEGLRSNGLDPAADMTPELEAAYQEAVASEFAYVDKFAADIAKASAEQSGLDPFRSRVDKWARRYTDVTNRAKLDSAEATQLYVWRYGDTIEHCADCKAQAGQVRTAAAWRELRARGIFPQSEDLECHGFECDCKIEKVAAEVKHFGPGDHESGSPQEAHAGGGTVTVFHGTGEGALRSILEKGIIPQGKRNFPDSQYEGTRKGKVFAADTAGGARNYAEFEAAKGGSKAFVIVANVPFSKGAEDEQQKGALMFDEIKPEWITGYYEYDIVDKATFSSGRTLVTLGNERFVTKSASLTIYVPIVVR